MESFLVLVFGSRPDAFVCVHGDRSFLALQEGAKAPFILNAWTFTARQHIGGDSVPRSNDYDLTNGVHEGKQDPWAPRQ